VGDGDGWYQDQDGALPLLSGQRHSCFLLRCLGFFMLHLVGTHCVQPVSRLLLLTFPVLGLQQICISLHQVQLRAFGV